LNQTLESLKSFATIALILCAIAGFSYHFFKEDGWIEYALGSIWSTSVRYPLIAIPVIIGAIFIGKMWRSEAAAHGKISKTPDLVIYAVMLAGAIFVGRFFMYGSF